MESNHRVNKLQAALREVLAEITPLEKLQKEAREEFTKDAVVLTQPDAEEIVEKGGDSSPFIYLEDILPEIDSLITKAYLQGIRDAKGAIANEEILNGPNDGTKYFVQGFNQCRDETLEAITRLEENVK